MAVNTGNENNDTQDTGTDTKRIDLGNTLDQSSPQAGAKDSTPILTFGSKSFNTMTSGLGSEYLNKLLEEIKALYAAEQNTGGYKVHAVSLDREVMTNLAYSCIGLSLLKGNKATYFIIVLEATGRKPLDAAGVMAELNNVNRMNQHQQRVGDIYVTSDAIDNVLHNEIVKKLMAVTPQGTKFYSADALVIPWYNENLEAANIRPIASIAYNACLVEGGKLNQEFRDLNIAAAKQENPNAHLKIDSNMLPATVKDATGKPVRADFTIELNSVDTRTQNQSINLQNNRNTVTRTSGFVDAMPVEIPTHAAPGMPQGSMLRLRPHVIISNMEADMPTTGYSLLSIVASIVMARPAMWLASVGPKSADSLHDNGKLNIITNLENNQNGIGDALDLKDPKLNAQEVFSLLKQMYSLDAMFSMDVEVYGPQTSHTSIFSIASAPGSNPEESDSKYNAAKEIIESAHWLSNGKFPLDYNPDKIFLNHGIVVPIGRWTDKDGNVRDIRDIDLSFIANVGQSTDLLNQWALSNVPHTISGLDPYITKVDIISKLVQNAEITGKAIRCTFHPEFMAALSGACAAAGLETRYDPEVQYSEQSNIAVLGDYLANAGIGQDVAGFARAFQGGGNYQTPYNVGPAHYRQY